MPRHRTYQPPQAQASQSYGEKTQQLQAQEQMPLPQGQGPPSPPPVGAPPPPPQVDDALLQVAQGFDPGITPLSAPSERPGEPVQAGLSLGPGPGPDIFSQPARANQAADVLTAMAQSTGNQEFLDMAARIRGSGGMR